VGLIGRNGAGKTTVLKTILGLTPYQGSVQVLGMEPERDRNALMSDVCFIADAAVLPRWLTVAHAIDYVAGVHPRFDRKRAEAVLATTGIRRGSRIGELSKGMITQLHLALILAIDARLLVLDEPTLGLDLIYRRQFYDTLLNDYFDKERTILLTTHQVEEVEHLLTDVLFIDRGRWCWTRRPTICRHASSSSRRCRQDRGRARARPFYVRELFGRTIMLYENRPADSLAGLGDLRTPRYRRPVRGQDAGGRVHESTADTNPARVLGAPRAVDRAAGDRRGDAAGGRDIRPYPASTSAAPRIHYDGPIPPPLAELVALGWAVPFYLAAAIQASAYLIDCLYAERRDRSILFWRSMPVTDARTVLVKLLVGLVLVPLGAFALAAATSLAGSAILVLRNHHVVINGQRGGTVEHAGMAAHAGHHALRPACRDALVCPVCRLPDAGLGMGAPFAVRLGAGAAAAAGGVGAHGIRHPLRRPHRQRRLQRIAAPGLRSAG
jgi:ABC-2 type transport system ATP-binding protein